MPEDKNSILSFDEWLDRLQSKLPRLGFSKALAFGASCCERMLPNYQMFSNEQNWGNVQTLRTGLDLTWAVLAARPSPSCKALSEAAKMIDAIAPDTEKFQSNLTSAALDAANLVSEILDYACDQEITHIVTVSSLARDTIDLFVHANNPDCAARWHLLTVAELTKQKEDIRKLESVEGMDTEFVPWFRRNATHAGKSNLGFHRLPASR